MCSYESGHSPEWWQWLLSGVAVVAGIALPATCISGILGGFLGNCAGSLYTKWHDSISYIISKILNNI